MARLRVHNFSVSLDGYGAGPDQSLADPIGVGGHRLHDWLVRTRTFGAILGNGGGETGLDDTHAQQGERGIGATIMGRKMFGPVRGPWKNDEWTGWWGDDPPYHHPVFVLTHHAREPITMEGGTTVHFVTGGIHDALEQAVDAAGGRDVRLGGGVSTIQQYLRAGLVDELAIAIVPVLLGRGERLFEGLADAPRYDCVELVSSPSVTHVRLVRNAGAEQE